VRESVATARGPRSRTLAGFHRLTPAVIDKAVRAASRPTSATEIHAAARRAGADSSAADAAARALLAEVANANMPSPGLRRLLTGLLSDPPVEDPIVGDAVRWLGAPQEDRARALRDLLVFVDALPPRPRRPLAFPPLIEARRAGG
jgi:hypothetical protein